MATLTTKQLCVIAAYGGGIDMVATKYSTKDLCDIAAYSKRANARLVLRGIDHLSAIELNEIAAHGKSSVIFVFT
jgi:hypothetical protein